MPLEWIPWINWTCAALSVALALAAIPLARRRAGTRAWWAHGVAAVAIGAVVAVTAHVAGFHYFNPWWRTATGCLAVLSVPPLAAAWSARSSVRRWPGRGWWVPAVATVATLVLVGAAGARVARMLLPDVIEAVQ